MKRAVPFLAAAAAACSTTVQQTAPVEFAAPTGLAATSAGNLDVLFIANEGRDNLRALQVCTSVPPTDGGVDADCPASQNFQFVPAPIRVFPATIETGDRPRRLAGVRLTRDDQSRTGSLLAAGSDAALRVVDARNLVEAANHKAQALPVLSLQLPAPAVDVVAENPLDPAGLEIGAAAGQAATTFVATVASGATPAQLLMMTAGLDAQGNAAVPVLVGQCSLGAVVPRKLAVVPGGGDRVYVADGAGDGVVAIAKASIPAPADPAPPCTMDRIPARGRSVRSISLSPPWSDGTNQHAAGELLIMVVEPKAPTSGPIPDSGGILIARTADRAIVPIPPFDLFNADPALQPMEPIAPPALPREVTFLRAIQPDGNVCKAIPCTPVYIGFPSTDPVARFALVAVTTSTDGGTYFIDVQHRRFVTTSFYTATGGQVPTISPQLFSPSTNDPNPPTLIFVKGDANHPDDGWTTVGVTRQAHWRVIFHAPFPGLETRGGMLTSSGSGTLVLKLPGTNLGAWRSDPALQLAAGDAVAFTRYEAPPGAPQPCVDLATAESQAPARFELTITGLPAPDTLELAPLQPSASVRAFDLSACPAGLGVVALVRAAGGRPWLVYQGSTVRGRAKKGETFAAAGQRFDYPLDYTTAAPPVSANETEIAFVLGGNDPITAGGGWTFSLSTGVDPVSFRDPTQGQGFATATLAYASRRQAQLVFTSVTGANTVLQADPLLLVSLSTGIVAYK